MAHLLVYTLRNLLAHNMKKIYLTLFILGAFSLGMNAQGWDDADAGDGWGDDSGDGWGDDSGDASDGTDYDYAPGSGAGGGDLADSSGADGWGDDSDWGDDDGGFDYGSGGGDYVRTARPKVEHKPYERFTGMPYDSASQLVSYVNVVEVIVPDRFLDLGGEDYSVSDSLFARAIKWMEKEFGKRKTKDMLDEAGMDKKGREGNTLKAYVTVPLMVKLNKYQTQESGSLEFDMELRFKDERYRYKFENFVHVQQSTSSKPEVTYMEYYVNAKKNIRNNDKILIACNDQMNKMIEGLKAECDRVPFIDDDDW